MIRRTIDRALQSGGYTLQRLPSPGALRSTHPDVEPEFERIHERCAPFTMTSVERAHSLWAATKHVVTKDVAGDIVECGVWRGGSSMLAALTLLELGETAKRLWLYDTFEGMNTPTEHDVTIDGMSAASNWQQISGDPDSPVLAFAALDDVRANLTSTGIDPGRLTFVKGPVEDTIPDQIPEQIALLRLDTDWYESTKHELEHLWDRLSPGGVLIIDDYGHWAGAREAVDEFFCGRADRPLLVRVDYTGRVAIKG